MKKNRGYLINLSVFFSNFVRNFCIKGSNQTTARQYFFNCNTDERRQIYFR